MKPIDDKEVTSERLDLFIDLYIEKGGDPQSAWVEAGYSPSTKKKAMSTLRANWQEVERRIRLRIGSHVPMALQGIVELARNAKAESVRLKAQQDIMKRAGYDVAEEFILTEKKAEDMDDSELKTELAELLKRSREESLPH
jgi:hypothetical protein